MIRSTLRAAAAKAALAGLALCPCAWADEPPPPPARTTPPVIGFFDAGKAHCWIRLYDDKHLAAHPKQKVTGIAFAYQPETSVDGGSEPNWDRYAPAPAFVGVLVVTFKGDTRPAFASADCQAGKDKTQLACGVEGDGGSFVLADPGGDQLRLDNAEGFTAERTAETDDDSYIRVDPKDDQQAFMLSAAQGGLCTTAYAQP